MQISYTCGGALETLIGACLMCEAQLDKISNVFGELLEKHKLNPDQDLLKYIIENHDRLGILRHGEHLQQKEMLQHYIGEYYNVISRMLGNMSAQFLFESKWNLYSHPDWFDHRISALSPDIYNKDFIALSGTQILVKMPLNAKCLSLCSGDGYYEYTYYRLRASVVDCVERQDSCLEHARLYHSSSNINYIKGDVLDFNFGKSKYDVVVIRGAIEHFTAEQQKEIFIKAKDALKNGGWFCGDTPEARSDGLKALEEHQCEWKSEDEMRASLQQVFSHIETMRYESHDVVTLFWACQK